MARRKNYYNFNDFNYEDGAIDLFHNTIRNSFQYDSLVDDVFEARVLTNPTPIVSNPTQLKFIPQEMFQRYSFRARILGTNSPHKFLEDPCLLDGASDDATANRIFSIIQNHIEVNLYDQKNEELPKIGDTVRIKLSRTGNTYDLKKARQYIGLVSSAESTAIVGSNKPDCSFLSNLFENFDFDDLGSLSNGESSWDGKYPDLNGPEVQRVYDLWVDLGGDEETYQKCGGVGGYEVKECQTVNIEGETITLHPDFYEKAHAALDAVRAQNFGESISMGSSKRTIKEQIRLRLGNKTRDMTDLEILSLNGEAGAFDPPTAPLPPTDTTSGYEPSRHILGLAIDFKGVLVKEGSKKAKLKNSLARQSRTFKWMKENVHGDGFLNTRSEPWHWSADGG